VFSSAAVFVLNALLAGIAFTLILRWKHQPKASALRAKFRRPMRVA